MRKTSNLRGTHVNLVRLTRLVVFPSEPWAFRVHTTLGSSHASESDILLAASSTVLSLWPAHRLWTIILLCLSCHHLILGNTRRKNQNFGAALWKKIFFDQSKLCYIRKRSSKSTNVHKTEMENFNPFSRNKRPFAVWYLPFKALVGWCFLSEGA